MSNKEHINMKMDEGLDILGRIPRAQPDEGLYDRIIAGLKRTPATSVPGTRIWLAAACMAGLMAINIWTIEKRAPIGNNGANLKVVADSYFGYANTQNLYP